MKRRRILILIICLFLLLAVVLFAWYQFRPRPVLHSGDAIMTYSVTRYGTNVSHSIPAEELQTLLESLTCRRTTHSFNSVYMDEVILIHCQLSSGGFVTVYLGAKNVCMFDHNTAPLHVFALDEACAERAIEALTNA